MLGDVDGRLLLNAAVLQPKRRRPSRSASRTHSSQARRLQANQTRWTNTPSKTTQDAPRSEKKKKDVCECRAVVMMMLDRTQGWLVASHGKVSMFQGDRESDASDASETGRTKNPNKPHGRVQDGMAERRVNFQQAPTPQSPKSTIPTFSNCQVPVPISKSLPRGPLIGGGSPLPAPEELFRTPAPTREKVGDAVTGDASAVAGTSPQFPPSMVGRGRPLVGLAGIQDNPMLPPSMPVG